MGMIARHRLGPGPVFVYEWVVASRRWQAYAVRSLFIAILLVALVVVWMGRGNRAGALRGAAELAETFFIAVVGTQLTLVFLAAPAATAGAICLDRSRGTLTHLLMTDLSAGEIVLGKLAARLVPVLTMVLCAFPVLTLLTLLGGVDPDGLIGAFLVTIGVAVLGSSLALVLSLWARRTHEALLGTYAVWALWLLGPLMIAAATSSFGAPPRTQLAINPAYLAFAPYIAPRTVGWADYEWFLGSTLAISAALALFAVIRLRTLSTRETVKRKPSPAPSSRPRSRWAEAIARLASRLPSPSLDANPVLWREWHRNRPSRWARAIAILYVALAAFFSVLAAAQGGSMPMGVNVFQVSVGLLLLSVTASTSLAEERARGSLDVLMATPLSTREIVLGKWLGAFRLVPLLAILPTFVILAASGAEVRQWPVALLMCVYVLVTGAAVTSLGLAIATWCSRLGRAVGLTVAAYVLVAIGWMFLVMGMTGPHPYGYPAIAASPVFGPAVVTSLLEPSQTRSIDFAGVVGWVVVYVSASVALLVATLATFDRCLGRVTGAKSVAPPLEPSRANGASPEIPVATTHTTQIEEYHEA
jgi:ABC-type transport system involved in multi-copper enzyme maturation permease subunit